MGARKKLLNLRQEKLFLGAAVETDKPIEPARPVRSDALFSVRLFAQKAERPAYRKSWSCKVLRSSEQYALEQARNYVARIGRMAGLHDAETTFLVERNGVLYEYYEYDGSGFRCVEEGCNDEQDDQGEVSSSENRAAGSKHASAK